MLISIILSQKPRSGVSTVYSPPPGEQGQSDLTRMFLQKGGSGGMTGPGPSPSNYMSQVWICFIHFFL